MKKNAKLAPSQTPLRQVAIFLHNADFPHLRVTKPPELNLQRDAASRVPYCLCTPHTNKLPPNTYKNLLTFKTNSVKIALAF